MKTILLTLICIPFLYLTSASDNSSLKTFQTGISDDISKTHARHTVSLPDWCKIGHLATYWVILVSRNGDVIIYHPESYEERIGYHAPELYQKNIGVVNREFYYIDTKEGIIWSTSIDQIIAPSIDKNGKPDIKWKSVGSFRAEYEANSCQPVVQGDTMYFGTYDGIVYSYNTTTKLVRYRFRLPDRTFHTSLTMFEDVLYISQNNLIYTYDGNVLKVFNTPGLLINDTSVEVNLIALGPSIIAIGSNGVEDKIGMIAKYPAYIWEPKEKNSTWQIFNYSYEARIRPALVISMEKLLFAFGGRRKTYNDEWKFTKSTELLVPSASVWQWNYAPSTPSMKPDYYSAVSFDCKKYLIES